jgi:hypothetical protein
MGGSEEKKAKKERYEQDVIAGKDGRKASFIRFLTKAIL